MQKDFNSKAVETRVRETVADHRMFLPKDSVLVAVSGGGDSVALLSLLRFLAPAYSLTLAVAHLNHCLRGAESDRDAEFVGRLAEKAGLPYFLKKADVKKYRRDHGLSLEEAAREVRYTFLYGVAQSNGFHKIALGHHADDNAELVLMYLCRGSGPLGLAGIPPLRIHERHRARIVRPLIRLKRQEIHGYLKKKRADYLHDTSNDDVRFMRNNIRCNLMPVLKKNYNPAIVDTLNRLAAIVRDEEAWMNDTVQPLFQACLTALREDRVVLSRRQISPLHAAVKRRIIRMAVSRVKGDLRRIQFNHVEAALALLSPSSGCKQLHLPGRIRIACNLQHIEFIKENRPLRNVPGGGSTAASPLFHYTVSRPDATPITIFVKEAGERLRFRTTTMKDLPATLDAGHSVAFFDMDMLRFPIVVRNFRSGDRFVPLGMKGHKTLKKFFIDQKVGRFLREKTIILADQNHIIWVVGHRIADTAKVTPTSRNILRAELLLA